MRRLQLLTWALVGLNFVDGVSTYTAIRLGIAHEVNPLMRALLNWHPVSFLAFKILFGTALVASLYYRNKHSKALAFVLAGLTVLYSLVMVQHVRLWAMAVWATLS